MHRHVGADGPVAEAVHEGRARPADVVACPLDSPRAIAALVMILLAVRVVLAALFPLTTDEGFYWLYSKHLALSYADHPPMIAFIDRGLVTLFRDPLLALRAGAVILNGLVLWLLALLARELMPNRPAAVRWRALLVFLLIPHTFVIWLVLTMDQPFVLCYLCALLAVVKFIRTGRDKYLYFAGVATGLGLLTKYTMVLFFPVIVLFVVLEREYRYLLRRPAFWGAGVLAILMMLPVVTAEAASRGGSLAFQARRVGAAPLLKWMLPFAGDQLLYMSPLLAGFAVWAYCAGRRDMRADPAIRLVAIAGAVPFVFFAALSVNTHVWPHWPAVSYAPFVLLVTWWLSSSPRPAALRLLVGAMAGMIAILLPVLLFWSPGVLCERAMYRANYALAARAHALLARHPRTMFLTDGNGMVAQLAYYAGVDATMSTGLLAPQPEWFGFGQFVRWNTRELRKGDDAVIFAAPDSPLHAGVRRYFESIEPLPGWTLVGIEDYEKQKQFYLAKGFRPERAIP
jgi:4-amino-4-deoxy-L-arabinose transferase-like glycosyltransferase